MTQPEQRVTLEAEPGPPAPGGAVNTWTVTVNGRIKYRGPSEVVAHRAYQWAAWRGHREKRGVARASAG